MTLLVAHRCGTQLVGDALHADVIATAVAEQARKRLREHEVDAPRLLDEWVQQNLVTPFQRSLLERGRGRQLRLGDYVILDRLNAGATSTVLKARHRRMNRLVALKVPLPSALRSARAVQRFQREIETIARLAHPNIVTAFDAREDDGIPYLVLEWVDGVDLGRLVETTGPLAAAEAIHYIRQTARGLAYAHDQGIVHRDVKPANLVLNRAGLIKILDLGLARSAEDVGDQNLELTQRGTIVGTVVYMAPEQAVNPSQADHRADIYSLGCTLFYLLTGRAMYAESLPMRQLIAHLEAPEPPLTGVPAGLSAIYHKMVAKLPGQRYRGMWEVIEALNGLGIGRRAEDHARDTRLEQTLRDRPAPRRVRWFRMPRQSESVAAPHAIHESAKEY